VHMRKLKTLSRNIEKMIRFEYPNNESMTKGLLELRRVIEINDMLKTDISKESKDKLIIERDTIKRILEIY